MERPSGPFICLSPPRPLLAGVEPEGAGEGELAQLVTDHRLGDVHRYVLATVVDGDGVPDHVGDHRRAARPRLDDPLLAARVEVVDLLEQVPVDEGALLEGTSHELPPGPACAATADDELLGCLGVVACAAFGDAPRRHRVPSTGRLALATTQGVVDGVHGHTAGLGADALPAVAAGLADGDELGLGVADLIS